LLHPLVLQGRFLVHQELEIIHLVHQSEERFLDHRQTDHSQIVRSVQASDHRCRAIVRVQSAQALPLDRLAPRVHQVPGDREERHEQAEQAEHQVHPRTVPHQLHRLELRRPLAGRVAVATNVVEPQAHLVSKGVKREKLIRVKKPCVKSSTIWRHHHSVEQSFHMAMEKLSFAYAVAHR